MNALAALLALALVAQEPQPAVERGLVVRRPGACEGPTLMAPLRSTSTYLLDMDGRVVHTWESDRRPGNAVYLMDDGTLFRCVRLDNERFEGGGQGGGLTLLSWEGELLWSWTLSDERNLAHHDVEPLPNGNLLVLAWEGVTAEQALAAGRDPQHVASKGLWPDVLFEVRPVLPDRAEVVWEWHSWDHLVQDRSAELANHGSPADHPERIDVNGDHRRDRPLSAAELLRQTEIEEEMRALGYLGGDDDEAEEEGTSDPKEREPASDWLHTNAVDYRADLDLIVLSVRRFSELWVIDHSTTTEEARGRTGGRWGRGGDLLYRWGNPRAYGAGEAADQRLFVQHDGRWIPEDCPGAGNLLVFNNGEGRPGGSYSSVDEIAPPLDPSRGFLREPGAAFAPSEATWSYTAPEPGSFFSSFISGAQRLPNGNTLACEGAKGRLVEVTPAGEIVWEYLNPFGEAPEGGPPRTGARPRGPRRGGMHPGGLFRATRLSPDHPGLAGRELVPID